MCLHIKRTRVLSRSLLHNRRFGSLQYFTQTLTIGVATGLLSVSVPHILGQHTLAHVPTRASTHWYMYLPGPAHTGACTYQGWHTLVHVPTRASTHWHMYLPGPAHTGTCTYQGRHTLVHVPTRASTHWHMYLPGPAHTGTCTYQGNYWTSSILLQPTTTMVRSSLHSSPHTRTECCTL